MLSKKHVYLCSVAHAYLVSLGGCQKKALNSLDLELQVVLSLPAGTRNQNQLL